MESSRLGGRGIMQVFIRRIDRPELLTFATGEFVKETKNKIVIIDYETEETIRYDKSVFEIFKPKKVV